MDGAVQGKKDWGAERTPPPKPPASFFWLIGAGSSRTLRRRSVVGLRTELATLPCALLAALLAWSGAARAQDGFAQRRDAVLAAQVARPFPNPACRPAPRPDNACIWGQATLAMAMLATGREPGATAEANRLLQEAARAVPSRPGWRRLANPAAGGASARVDPAFDFPFLTATLFYRAVGAFGALRPGGAARLEPATEAAIRTLFRDWVLGGCRLEDAAPAMVWRPWGTENHDIQRVHACWAGADLLRRDPAAPPYADGSTAARQYAAWSDYLKRFIRARGMAGVTVEFFSPTYSKYFLGPLYNVMDFAEDPSLAQLARNLVTLWWALWAEEQIGGVHGGSKARVYAEAMDAETPMDGVAWAYLGLGPRTAAAGHPAHLPMLLSPYQLPAAIADLARDAPGRGSYEAWTREPGFVAGPVAAERIPIAPDPAITRYAYATPDFVMGAILAPRLPNQQWASISSQNRWNGVILAGAPDARVYAAPAPTGGRSTYNAVIAAQSRATQIVQRLPPPLSRGAGEMAIWIGPSLRRSERGGWIFASGGAYVAARPAFGGYSAAESRFVLADQRAPVVILAARRDEYASFEAFQSAVLAAPLAVTAEAVEFRPPGGGTLRSFLDGLRPAELDGRPIAMPAGWTLLSPFIRQRTGEASVEIAKGTERVTLRFDIGN